MGNPPMKQLRIACLAWAGLGLLLAVVGLVSGKASLWQWPGVTSMVALAIGLGAVRALKGFQFTAWILASVVAAMVFPERFLHVGDFDLRNKWLLLVIVQLVMFGMGTQMKLRDFAGVMRMPYGVFIGVGLQYTVMPLTGFALAKACGFPPEIAAGVVLIGSCSSGLASNVMSWLAGANLPLSITLTAVATVLAPLMTPLWMKVLAGEFVEVGYFKMMLEIVKIVLVPIGAALLHDYLRKAGRAGWNVVLFVSGIGIVWLGFLALGGWSSVAERIAWPERLAVVGMVGFVLAAVLVGLAYHGLVRIWAGVERWMPVFSMFGIVYFTAVTTAAGRDSLLRIGALLFVAAIIHNTLGYLLGYWLSRLCGLDAKSARTVGFEVGMQNGGMASGLASAMGKLGTVGLASAIFSPWMNISGSVLANFWKRRPVGGEKSGSLGEK